jgi:hypothetical protein
LTGRLRTAEAAFADAGSALAAYAHAHADARFDAARALQLWQSAKHASDIAHGAVVGAMPAGAPADPDAVLTRAAALAHDAQDRFLVAGRTLAETLQRAEEGHPKNPGLFSIVRRAARSFGLGLTTTATGPVEGVAIGVDLGVHLLDVGEATRNPHAYLATWQALGTGLTHAITHPQGIGKALIEWDTWEEDPARALGELLPELLGVGLAARELGTARELGANSRLRSAADVIKQARKDGLPVFNRADADLAARRLEELHLDPASAAGRAAWQQLEPPFGAPDGWEPVHLKPGDQILVDRDGNATLLGETYPTDARTWNEQLQLPPQRQILSDGSVSDPMYKSQVAVFKVGENGLDSVGASTVANPQFGAGGGFRLSIQDLDAAVGDGRLEHQGIHNFDPNSLKGAIEDPRYRHIDHDLPQRPLDPKHERTMGQVEAVVEEVRGSVRQTVLTAGASAALHQTDQGER